MKKTWVPHIAAIGASAVFIVLGLACANTSASTKTGGTVSDTDAAELSYPLLGISNNANIATKDFTTIGIIFIDSVEIIDSVEGHTGSKITYEMFLREAVKLKADDVINIKIDVNHKKETQKIPTTGGGTKTRTINTYTYIGTGLAIKYTNAIGSSNTSTIDISDTTQGSPKNR